MNDCKEKKGRLTFAEINTMLNEREGTSICTHIAHRYRQVLLSRMQRNRHKGIARAVKSSLGNVFKYSATTTTTMTTAAMYNL